MVWEYHLISILAGTISFYIYYMHQHQAKHVDMAKTVCAPSASVEHTDCSHYSFGEARLLLSVWSEVCDLPAIHTVCA